MRKIIFVMTFIAAFNIQAAQIKHQAGVVKNFSKKYIELVNNKRTFRIYFSDTKKLDAYKQKKGRVIISAEKKNIYVKDGRKFYRLSDGELLK